MNVFSGTNNLKEIKNIFKILKTNSIVNGSELIKYKVSLENKLNSNNIYTFASGRMGFYSILITINIQESDEIIIPSYTCVVVPNAIIYSGAKPIYCDISSTDFNIDVSKIEALITPNTKVLYAQHTFGQMCDMDIIMKLANKYNLLVIEDTALAIGAKINDKFAGTIGDFGYYSTDRSKVINTGLGGIVSVNNTKYINNFNTYYSDLPFLNKKYTQKITYTFILNLITLHPSFYWLGKFLNAIFSKLKIMTYFLDEAITNLKDIKDYPYPAKLSNIFANIGISQIDNLGSNLDNRKTMVKYYNEILNIYSEDYICDSQNIFLRYSFLIKNREYWENRFSSKIDLSIWFKTIASGKNDNFDEIGYKVGTNRVSEYVCKHIFNLPTHNKIRPERLKKLLVELKNSGDIITKEKVL
jgi:dTDP-4-amino-4,6-dideoxygalactose transaminase